MKTVVYKTMLKSPEGLYCVRTILEDGTPVTLDIFKQYEKARSHFAKLPYAKAPDTSLEAFQEITRMAG